MFVTEIYPAAIERPANDPEDDDETILGDFRRALAENEAQESKLVKPVEQGGDGLDALWNDDFHTAQWWRQQAGAKPITRTIAGRRRN